MFAPSKRILLKKSELSSRSNALHALANGFFCSDTLLNNNKKLNAKNMSKSYLCLTRLINLHYKQNERNIYFSVRNLSKEL